MTAPVTVVDDQASLVAQAAAQIATLTSEAVARRGRASIALTGGRTARALYHLLANPVEPWRQSIPWPALDLFWSDERCVPPSHADSNYGMAVDALLHHVPVVATAVHRMRGEDENPHAAAADYARQLHPLDISLLSLGDDAHVASLFPRSDALRERERLAVAVRPSHLRLWRLTLTPTALLAAGTTIVIASGVAKADAVAAAMHDTGDVDRCPARVLRAAGERVRWIIDRPAAGRWRAAPPS